MTCIFYFIQFFIEFFQFFIWVSDQWFVIYIFAILIVLQLPFLGKFHLIILCLVIYLLTILFLFFFLLLQFVLILRDVCFSTHQGISKRHGILSLSMFIYLCISLLIYIAGRRSNNWEPKLLAWIFSSETKGKYFIYFLLDKYIWSILEIKFVECMSFLPPITHRKFTCITINWVFWITNQLHYSVTHLVSQVFLECGNITDEGSNVILFLLVLILKLFLLIQQTFSGLLIYLLSTCSIHICILRSPNSP